jgi:hypothetical protein
MTRAMSRCLQAAKPKRQRRRRPPIQARMQRATRIGLSVFLKYAIAGVGLN